MLTAAPTLPGEAEPEAGEPAAFPRLVPGISSWPFFPEKVAADGRRLDAGVSIVGSLALSIGEEITPGDW